MSLSRSMLVCALPVVVASAGCQGPAQLMEFGPEATVSASNIIPGCEGLTAIGEFSSVIRFGLQSEIDAGDLLLDIDRAILGGGDMVMLPVDESIAFDFGDTVCVWSTDTEEHDDFSNDSLNEARDCLEVTEEITSTVFSLAMTSGSCTLSVSIPAVISSP